MSSPFLAEVRVFPLTFAPSGWAFCAGQLLNISTNTALFSLLGTYFGGNGKSNFALPNMGDNIPIGQGNGPGLPPYNLGETGGSQTVTLLQTEVPGHSHNLMADKVNGPDNTSPSNAAISQPAAIYSNAASPIAKFSGQAILANGSGQPHNNMMPFLALNFCIALVGIYPPRG